MSVPLALRARAAASNRLDRLRRRIGAADGSIGMDVTLAGLAARGFKPNSVLDVGAATGSWTELALRHWPDASYLLVEPLRERCANLDAISAAHPRLEWVQAAAGGEAGTRTLHVSNDLDGSSFLYEGVAEREVPLVVVDELLATRGLPTPELVKIDVQGFELDVLGGARRVLEDGHLILLEAHLFRGLPGMPMLHEVINWMVERNWRPYELAGVLRRPYDGAMAQCDVLFAREGTPLLSVEGWL